MNTDYHILKVRGILQSLIYLIKFDIYLCNK